MCRLAATAVGQGAARTTNNLPFYDASLYRRITNADALSIVEETYQ